MENKISGVGGAKLKIHSIGVDKLGFIEAGACRLAIFPSDSLNYTLGALAIQNSSAFLKLF